MNNIIEQINKNLLPSLSNSTIVHVNQDPVSKLLSSLYSARGIEVSIRGQDDVFIEDFFQNNKKTNITIDVNKDLKLFSKPETVPNIFGNKRQPDFPNQQQKAILLKLKNIPVYTVVNGYNEVVIASPRNTEAKNTIEWLYDKYCENFLWKEDRGAINLGLFFVDKEDAETYMQEVCKKDPKGAEKIGLNVKSVGLDTFYELNRTSKPKMQVKLIADLKEIDLLLNEYCNDKNLNFHPKQKYRKIWFQGNPVYFIKLNEELDTINRKKFALSKYKFDNSFGINRKILLFKKDDAYKVWDIYRSKNPSLNLPELPSLEVYNLENYLLDLEKSDISLTQQTTFVPPYKAYQDFKIESQKSQSNESLSINETLKKYMSSQIKSFQRFYKGIVWLVTSDTLPNEESAW